MDIDFTALAARIAADLPGLQGCVIVSRDGLVLGSYPQDGERILRPAWLRFASLGEVEKGFIQFPGELWVYVRRGPYAAFATSSDTRPGLLLDEMEQVLAGVEDARAAAAPGVTIPDSPEVTRPPAAAPQPPAPVAPPPAPVQQAPQVPVPAPQAAPPAAAPQPPVPAQTPQPAPQAAPQAAPPAVPAQPAPQPQPVPVAPQAGYHADYSGEAPAGAPAPMDPAASPAAAPVDDIQIDRVALAQEFASLLAETGYDDEDDSA